MRLSAATAVLAVLVLLSSPLDADPVLGQVDTFEDGTTQGWSVGFAGIGTHPAPPVNALGGPAGADDNFLLLTALGTSGLPAGSRLTVGNDEQWAGDYLAAGIEAITMDVLNLGNTDLFLRLVFEDPLGGPPENVAFSTDALFVPAGGGWTSITFLIGPGDLTAGLGSVLDALSNATLIRLYHSEDPNFPNPVFPIDPVVAQLGVDNITAASVAEPRVLFLMGLGLALAGAYCRRGLSRPSCR